MQSLSCIFTHSLIKHLMKCFGKVLADFSPIIFGRRSRPCSNLVISNQQINLADCWLALGLPTSVKAGFIGKGKTSISQPNSLNSAANSLVKVVFQVLTG